MKQDLGNPVSLSASGFVHNSALTCRKNYAGHYAGQARNQATRFIFNFVEQVESFGNLRKKGCSICTI